MANILEEYLSNALEDIHPELVNSLEVGFEFIPYIGKLITHRKLNRLTRRLNEHREQLYKIAELHSSEVLSADYINERISPIVLESLIEEHEDAKIQFILNGFENVFIEEKTMESMVINYYDTLKNLRYLDLKRLASLTSKTKEYNYAGIEEKAVTLNIDMKLLNQGLLGMMSRGIQFGGPVLEKHLTRDSVILYSYGESFIKFINLHNDT